MLCFIYRVIGEQRLRQNAQHVEHCYCCRDWSSRRVLLAAGLRLSTICTTLRR